MKRKGLKLSFLLLIVLLSGLVISSSVAATFTQITQPDAAYLASTTKIDISGLPFNSNHSAISDGVLTVNFSTPMSKRGPVPTGWATWSSPPWSETATPHVLWSNGASSLNMTLSKPVTTFGFELEPNPFSTITYNVDFILMSGTTTVGTITIPVNGAAGARLFAASVSGGSFDRIVVNGGADFSIAQVRYIAPPCPDIPGNILQNPCFETGETPWKFYSNGWGGFETTTPPYDGYFSGRVEIGSVASNIQLYQYDLPLEPNQGYLLRFSAKSSGGENVKVFLHKHGTPYTNYGLAQEFDLATEWGEPFEFPFTTNELAEPDARLRFWLAPFAKEGTVYWFDNVYLIKVTDGVPPPTPPSPQVVPVPEPGHCDPPIASNALDNPGFEDSVIAPWKFYTDGKGYALPVSSTFYECTQSARVKIREQGSNVQLFQYGLDLQPNTSYQLRLAAKSTDGRDVRLYLHKHRAPYTNYGLNGLPLDLTEDWQVFVVQFTTTGFSLPVSDGRLRIWLAGSDAPGAEYYFDDVVMVPLDGLTTTAVHEGLSDLQSFSTLDRQMESSSVTTGQLLISGYFIDDDDEGRAQGAFLPINPKIRQCENAQASHTTLWPADGGMVNVKIVGAGKPTNMEITGIWQDEPVGTEPDAVIMGEEALLRAERMDNGNGRVYHVAFSATYRNGLTCSHEVLVTVPLQKRAGALVFDNGPLANSTLP